MKNSNNLKNTVAAAGLMAVMTIGTISASAGVIETDRSSNGGAAPCSTVKGGLLAQLSGILIVGLPMFDGLMVSDRTGLMVSDRSGLMVSDRGECGKTGLMVSDRSGLMVSDRTGLLVSD